MSYHSVMFPSHKALKRCRNNFFTTGSGPVAFLLFTLFNYRWRKKKKKGRPRKKLWTVDLVHAERRTFCSPLTHKLHELRSRISLTHSLLLSTISYLTWYQTIHRNEAQLYYQRKAWVTPNPMSCTYFSHAILAYITSLGNIVWCHTSTQAHSLSCTHSSKHERNFLLSWPCCVMFLSIEETTFPPTNAWFLYHFSCFLKPKKTFSATTCMVFLCLVSSSCSNSSITTAQFPPFFLPFSCIRNTPLFLLSMTVTWTM